MSQLQSGVISLHPGWAPELTIEESARLAREAGFDAVELSLPKLKDFTSDGAADKVLVAALDGLPVSMAGALLGIESPDRRLANLDLCRRVVDWEETLGIPALQVVVLDGFTDLRPDGMLERVETTLNELADIAEPHGIRLALEPVSFSPFKDLDLAIEVISRVGKERVGLVLDTWHLWTAGVPWSQVATIDPSLIVCAHIGDSVWHRQVNWSDDDRNVLPGDGVVPLPQAVAAITETGFPGPWSVELLGSPSGWEPAALAAEMLRRARSILGRFE